MSNCVQLADEAKCYEEAALQAYKVWNQHSGTIIEGLSNKAIQDKYDEYGSKMRPAVSWAIQFYTTALAMVDKPSFLMYEDRLSMHTELSKCYNKAVGLSQDITTRCIWDGGKAQEENKNTKKFTLKLWLSKLEWELEIHEHMAALERHRARYYQWLRYKEDLSKGQE